MLRSEDGRLYTGLVVVERNELVMMLAYRHEGIGRRPEAVPTREPSRSQTVLFGSRFDPDDPIWDRDGDPFRR